MRGPSKESRAACERGNALWRANSACVFQNRKACCGDSGRAAIYDFNIYSHAEVLEKLHYMHSNPVREKLVNHPGDWPWSRWCSYYRGKGLIAIDPWDSRSSSFSSKPQQ